MEVQFWIDSKASIEADGLYTSYRILADIPDPFNISIFNDSNDQELDFSSLPIEDQSLVLAELNLRTKEYVSWTDNLFNKFIDLNNLQIKEMNNIRGIK